MLSTAIYAQVGTYLFGAHFIPPLYNYLGGPSLQH